MAISYFEHIAIADVPVKSPVNLFRKYWESKPKVGDLVPWSDFSPMDVPQVLPWVLMFQKKEDGRFLFKINGSGCEEIFGRSFQGKYLEEALPVDAVRQRLDEFTLIEQGKGPLYSRSNIPINDKEHKGVYRGVFGFCDENGVLDRIIAVIAPA